MRGGKKMCDIEKMNKIYKKWIESAKIQSDEGVLDLNPAIEEKLIDIANENDFEYLYKDDLLIIFKNKNNDLLFAWHNDHDRNYTEDETGFDDLNLYSIYNEGLLTNDGFRYVFNETNEYQNIYHKRIKKSAY